MDIEAIKADVETIIKNKPSSGGAQRNVWFLGDLVVKEDIYDDNDDETYCKAEYENYVAFCERPGKQKFRYGRAWGNIAVPEMTMLGKYVVARRVKKGVHLPYNAAECDSPACENRENECKNPEPHDKIWCEDCYHYKHGGHVKACEIGKIIRAVEKWCEDKLGLWDMHSGNFYWDAETKTAWLVDIAA